MYARSSLSAALDITYPLPMNYTPLAMGNSIHVESGETTKGIEVQITSGQTLKWRHISLNTDQLIRVSL